MKWIPNKQYFKYKMVNTIVYLFAVFIIFLQAGMITSLLMGMPLILFTLWVFWSNP